MEMVVVLPAPFGPSTPYTVPASTRRSTPSTARSVPKVFTRPTASTARGAVVIAVPFVDVEDDGAAEHSHGTDAVLTSVPWGCE